MTLLKHHFFASALLLGVGVILLFNFIAVSGSRDRYRSNNPGKWERAVPNNSKVSTSFAVHIEPYSIFSEDFHLYLLRTKRYLENGFTENILEPSVSATQPIPPYYIQFLLHIIPATTGYDVVNYACFIAVMLLIVYSILYFCIHMHIGNSYVSILSILLLLLYFERILRLSSYFYSVPLLLILLLTCASLLFSKQIKSFQTWTISLILFLLSGIEMWSFMIALVAAGSTITLIFFSSIQEHWQENKAKNLRHLLLIFITIIVTCIVFTVTSKGGISDLQLRAGIGDLYKTEWKNYFAYYFKEFYREALFLCFIPLSFTLAIQPFRKWVVAIIKKINPENSQRVFLLLVSILLLNFSALITLLFFFTVGINIYQSTHIVMMSGKISFVLAFMMLLLTGLENKYLKPSGKKIIVVALSGILLLGVSYRFSKLTVRSEKYLTFGIPSYYEEVIEYLKKEKQQKNKSVLTLSHEFNYLLAYHTNFDLLLPEGFPLHSNDSNIRLYERMNDISKLLQITPENWENFILNQTPMDQVSWHEDRVLSARQGYSYYLFHRGFVLGHKFGHEDYRMHPSLSQEMIDYMKHHKDQNRLRPTFIIVDSVVKWFPYSIPQDYTFAYSSKDGNVLVYKLKI